MPCVYIRAILTTCVILLQGDFTWLELEWLVFDMSVVQDPYIVD